MIRFDPNSEALLDALARDLREQYPTVPAVTREAWPSAALRVVDCALAVGLGEEPLAVWGEAYAEGVVPHVEAFAQAHPEVRTLADLGALVASYASPEAVAQAALAGADPRRGEVVRDLTAHLLRDQATYSDAADEPARLAEWAALTLGDAGGFYDGDPYLVGDAGFLYLRRLFGAPVALPGPHVEAWAHETSRGRSLLPEDDLGLAAERARLPLAGVEREIRRDYLDGFAWGERRTAPEAGAWVRFFRDLAEALGQRGRPDPAEAARLHASAPHRPRGADLDEPLARLGALEQDTHGGHGALATLFLATLYLDAIGYSIDADLQLETAREAAARHLQTQPLGAALRDAIGALAPEATGGAVS